MPSDKQAPKELKVTDKRIFTSDGEIREEFKKEITPASPQAATPAPAEPAAAAVAPPPPAQEKKRRPVGERAENPGTPFANFAQSLVMQAYMFLGMLRDPRQAQPMFDAAAARETIDILILLQEKTAGNLTDDEIDFLEAHLGELKLAYVQRTKSLR